MDVLWDEWSQIVANKLARNLNAKQHDCIEPMRLLQLPGLPLTPPGDDDRTKCLRNLTKIYVSYKDSAGYHSQSATWPNNLSVNTYT